MWDEFSRTERVLGRKAMEKLAESRVILFGIGGVGGYVMEALVRSGLGSLDIVDNDTVAPTNLNRQILATRDSLGKSKVEVARERIMAINPDIHLTVHPCFYLPETADQFDFSAYDCVVDAIDTVSGKISIILEAQKCQVPVISCMGMGNKVDPCQIRLADIYETSMDPLAKVMRHELKKRGVKSLPVVYSQEAPIPPSETALKEETNKRVVPGSTAFVPSCAGLVMASWVVRTLTQFDPEKKEAQESADTETAV